MLRRAPDFSVQDCSERLNGPHCPHVRSERVHSASVVCCWCGAEWTEPRSWAFDRHGTYVPKAAQPAREEGS